MSGQMDRIISQRSRGDSSIVLELPQEEAEVRSEEAFCMACEANDVVCGGYELRLDDFQPKGVYNGQMVCRLVTAPSSGQRMISRGETTNDDGQRPLQQPQRRQRRRADPSESPPNRITTEAIPSCGFSQSQGDSTVSCPQSVPALTAANAEPLLDREDFSDETSCELSPVVGSESWPGRDAPTSLSLHDTTMSMLCGDVDDDGFLTFIDTLTGLATPESANLRVSSSSAIVHLTSESACPDDESMEQDMEAVLERDLQRPSSAETPSTPICSSISGTSVSLAGPFDSYLYSYFFNVLTPFLHRISQEPNPYKSLYGSLASSFLPLRATILVASARHMSSMGKLPTEVVLLYRDALRTTFAESLTSPHDGQALAATLLFKIHSDLSTHPPQARKLLLDQGADIHLRKRSPFFAFLNLHFNWMAVVGQIMQQECSHSWHGEVLDLIDSDDCPEEEESVAHAHWFSNSPDYGALLFLKQLNQLHREVSQARSSACFTTLQHIIADIADLRVRIHLWQPSPPTPFATPASDGANVNEIWRQGLLCYLYADICALPSSDERIQECVARGIVALRELSWMHSIIFPTFMMGIHALTAQHRAVLECSYRAMTDSLNFSAPLSIVQLLKKVWIELDANESGMSNWRRLMRESDIQINLAF